MFGGLLLLAKKLNEMDRGVISLPVLLLVLAAFYSTNALKCYELVDSKCHLVECAGSCYYGNITLGERMLRADAKCWNDKQKDGCKENWKDFNVKYDCYCNHDKCNDKYCGSHSTYSPTDVSKSTSFPPKPQRSTSDGEDNGYATEENNSITNSSTRTSRPSSSTTSSTTTSTSTTTTSTTTKSSTSTKTTTPSSTSASNGENTENPYESSSTESTSTTPKSSGTRITGAFTTVQSVIVVIFAWKITKYI